MSRAVRAEILKLRTSRLPWGLLGITAALTALHSVLFDSNAGGTGHTAIPSLAAIAGQRRAIGVPAEVFLLATVLGVIVASGEFRHGTATATYLAIPNRVRVLGAKAVAASTVGLLFGLSGAAITTTIGIAFITAGGDTVLLAAGTIIRYGAGAAVGAALLAAAGVGLGSLLRSQVGAIIAVFVWGFVVEQTVGGVFESTQRYFPYTAAAGLGGTDLGGGQPLPFALAVVLLLGVAGAVGSVAARTTVMADVT